MCKKFGYEQEDQREFAALSKTKFTNRTIIDTVAINAREPHRKLGTDERIIGAAKLLHERREDASVLEMTAASAVIYTDHSDSAWSKIEEEKTNEQILNYICGLCEDSVIYKNIMGYVKEFTK